MNDEVMLSTRDNPYNPHTQYEEWVAWDEGSGYFTNAYLARIAKTSDELSPASLDYALKEAIDEIIKLNINGLYIKVYKDTSVLT